MAARGTPLARLRALCLALPEAEERETWGIPTFRVRSKIFAMAPGGGTEAWCKAPPGGQAVLVGADPHRFFAPPYVGPKGWIGIRLTDGPDWEEVAVLIRRSYRLVAPKRLVLKVPAEGEDIAG
jgi:predicted DNA-binding protein (MmcQ/YjbR family)